MKNLKFTLLFLLTACVCNAQSIEPFKKGDKIAFVGNSITEIGYYESYIWLYYMLHFPNQQIEIFNKGIGGNNAMDMYKRWDADILDCKPNIITLSFGMNDSKYFEYLKPNAEQEAKDAVETTFKSYKLLEKRMLELKDVKKILIATSPYDETRKRAGDQIFPGKTLTMLEIAKFQEEAAKQNNWGFVDFLRPMLDITAKQQLVDSTYTLIGSDRIHPGNGGNLVMAYLFLKSQGLTGSCVADIKIDASRKKIADAQNCTITNLSVKPQLITFDYLANSLPFPVENYSRIPDNPQKQSDALKVVPFTEDLNREMLALKGLKGKNYSLKIDNQEIGQWSAADFGKGINLAILTNTPQYKQAQKIAELNFQRYKIEGNFRAYNWMEFSFFQDKGMLYTDDDVAVDTLMAHADKEWGPAVNKDRYMSMRLKGVRDCWTTEMHRITDKIYAIAKPTSHKLEIVEVK